MILSYTKNAVNRYAHVYIKTLEVVHLDVPLTDARLDPISPIDATSFLIVGSGNALQQGVYHVSLDAGLRATTTLLAAAASKSYPAGTFSEPEVVALVSQRTAPRRPIHGFYWPPHNTRYAAPEGTLPPLLVHPHGGPTAHSGPGLKIGGGSGGGLGNAAFWTSRGFGYFVLNYTGSSGHGRAYRQRLQGQWGVLDRDDVLECVEYLCSAAAPTTTGAKGPPRADRRRVGIHGASAGGYNVLQSLVWHPGVFAAGVSYCGVSDVQALAEGTHKLESHYLFGLLYPDRQQGEEEDTDEKQRAAVIGHARSPLFHAHRIAAPLLLCHGDRDTVVPIAQNE